MSDPEPIVSPEQLGALIRSHRKAQGLTQATLADLCGVGIRFVRELEQGKPTAQVGKALAVMTTLGLRIHVSHAQGTPT
jgi:y4mF family transcriptional regulator